ncbi:hypothetical protein QQF64_008602 [Cirrhinus molitorella]|uniref:Uncharacterized protein n=1 Tax=Cirrhinus molitorella TaxID=172907 RepID=A0ABR3M7E3_9TELE
MGFYSVTIPINVKALVSAAVVFNAGSRCRRFFSLNNKQHEANLPPLSLYIYNSARLFTFSCAHLEDRANRNNTVPCQKTGYLTTGAVINPFWMYRSHSVSVWKNRLLVKTLELL